MKERLNDLKITISDMKMYTIMRLKSRGVEIEDISKVAYEYLNVHKNISVTLDECNACVLEVLDKREILHKVLLGIDIDELAEQKLIPSPISSVIQADDGLFGIDELFGIDIADIYGAIGYSAFGFFDKVKPGIINDLDTSSKQVNTFLDDLVCGIAAAVSSKLLHKKLNFVNLDTLKGRVVHGLSSIGITIRDISLLVYNEQSKYSPCLTLEYCEKELDDILSKREILNKLLLCLALNSLKSTNFVEEPFLNELFANDEQLFGINKEIGMNISELYGSIGYSNFGYFCEIKPGIISTLSSDQTSSVFIIDAICGLAAAASGKVAHNYRGTNF